MPSSSNGKEQATGNCAIGCVRMVHGAYAGGDLIHLQSDWPAHRLIGRFAATETAGDDLVFALHGSYRPFRWVDD